MEYHDQYYWYCGWLFGDGYRPDGNLFLPWMSTRRAFRYTALYHYCISCANTFYSVAYVENMEWRPTMEGDDAEFYSLSSSVINTNFNKLGRTFCSAIADLTDLMKLSLKTLSQLNTNFQKRWVTRITFSDEMRSPFTNSIKSDRHFPLRLPKIIPTSKTIAVFPSTSQKRSPNAGLTH